MKNFISIGTVDMLPVQLQLDRNPQLWNANPDRKTRDNSPHDEMNDIWLRFRKKEELTDVSKYSSEHFPVWYPAINDLYDIRPIINQVMARVHCVHLGGVLITKIAPGSKVKEHRDHGWHAEYHNCKVYIPIKANENCINMCGDETMVMRVGEVWTFNNLLMHSVENWGNDDRITLIISMRCE